MVQYRKQWKGKLDDPLSRWLAWLNMGRRKELAERPFSEIAEFTGLPLDAIEKL